MRVRCGISTRSISSFSLFHLSGQVASLRLQSKPGYAKLILPSWLSTNTTLALNLGPRGLKPVKWIVNRAVDASEHELELPG